MADVNYKIVIEVSGDGGGGKQKTAVSPSTSGKKTQTDEGEATAWDALNSVRKLMKTAPAAFAIQVARKGISNEISRVALRTGHQYYQEKLQYQYGLVSRGVDLLGSIAGGAVTGIATTGNPIGGAAGAVVGAVISVANMAVDYYSTEATINLQRQVDAIGKHEANIRSGALGDRKRY